MKMKPGYRTSEFWFTLVSFLFSGFYLVGVIGENDQKEELITVVSHAVESVILISGQFFIFYRYLKGRTEVKKIVETEKLEEIKQQKSTPKPRKKNNVSKRTSTSSSRSNNTTSQRVPTKPKKNSTK